MAENAAVIKSAGRVLEIFEYFGEKRAPLSVREIAEHLEYPLSSTAALMKSLDVLGYVSYERHLRAYLPTVRLSRLGEWVYDAIAHKQGLVELLARLAEKTGETAILSAENDIYAQIVHMVPGDYHIQLQVPPGTRRLLCQSVIGWAMITGFNDAKVAGLVARTRALLGRAGASLSMQQVMAHVEVARARGFAFGRSLTTKETGTVALAIPQPEGQAGLAVSVSGLWKRMEKSREAIAQELRHEVDGFLRMANEEKSARARARG